MAQAQTADINLTEILRQVAREKDIDLERWISALEDAMASAAKKQHRIKEPVRSHLDRETGRFDAFIVKKVVVEVEDPLAEWTEAQVWTYLRENAVPYNRLYDQGYRSIGCAPCTRPTLPHEELRAGRWWWEAADRKECGLHPVTECGLHPAKMREETDAR